jgi:hypothetical protein
MSAANRNRQRAASKLNLSPTPSFPIPHSHTPHWLVSLYHSITDLYQQADIIRQRHYGVIDMVDGRLDRILLRPYPKYVSVFEAIFWGGFCHRRMPGDRLRLFYNQPKRYPNYLSLKYAVSARDTSLASMLGALATLDEIARLKRSDAILTDAANFRISDRFLRRQGWERHTKSRYHRNYIKRFYGEYPAVRKLDLRPSATPLEAVSLNDE